MKTIQEARTLLQRLPRQSLGFYPTPLHRLERLSRQLGVELYLKRDDLSGVNLFGGNKIRKLEYLLGDAVDRGCGAAITYGATQSNHAMQTAAACRRCGLAPILYLVSVVEPDSRQLRANLLLDSVLGAEVHIVPMAPGETEEEAEARAFRMGADHAARLVAPGTGCCDIPMGGAKPLGVAADWVCHATGTGGTLAGLAAGRALLGDDTRILPVSVSAKDTGYEARTARLANEALALLGAEERVEAEALAVARDYYAPGYEIPNEAGNGAVRLLARTEGILLDPVYSGKAFGGMVDQIRRGRIPQGSTVVFWHTGGATALFAEGEIAGDLAQREEG